MRRFDGWTEGTDKHTRKGGPLKMRGGGGGKVKENVPNNKVEQRATQRSK